MKVIETNDESSVFLIQLKLNKSIRLMQNLVVFNFSQRMTSDR